MPILPSFGSSKDENTDSDSSGPLLSDTLPLTRRINVFASLLRDHPNLPALLASPSPSLNDPSNPPNKDAQSTNFTILAPLNSAMQAQTHKPWESGDDYSAMGEQAYDGSGGQERADRNLRGFVERHVIPVSPWVEGEEKGKVRTLGGGKEVWWETKDGGKKVVMPDGVEVDDVPSKVGNGEIWVLKGVLKP